MANPQIETNYGGEVLDTILTQAATGNQVFNKGLVNLQTNVGSSLSIPRLAASKFLQKRKDSPLTGDSKGNFTLTDLKITPQDMMVYVEFNPRNLESYWRAYQPTGNLVFSELPDNVKEKFLEVLVGMVGEEVGFHLLMGKKGNAEGEYFDGVVTRILAAPNANKVITAETSIIKRLEAVWLATSAKVRQNPNFVFMLSQGDADRYDAELTALTSKAADPTGVNPMRFKGKRVEGLNDMPDGLIVATIASMGLDSNLFAACNLAEDAQAVQVEKVSASSEKYFFKMLMKYDTGVAFPELCTVLDARVTLAVGTVAEFAKGGGTKTATVTASSAWDATITEGAEWLTTAQEGGKIKVTAAANDTTSAPARTGSITVTCCHETATVTISQAANA